MRCHGAYTAANMVNLPLAHCTALPTKSQLITTCCAPAPGSEPIRPRLAQPSASHAQQMECFSLGLHRSLRGATQATEIHCSGSGTFSPLYLQSHRADRREGVSKMAFAGILKRQAVEECADREGWHDVIGSRNKLDRDTGIAAGSGAAAHVECLLQVYLA